MAHKPQSNWKNSFSRGGSKDLLSWNKKFRFLFENLTYFMKVCQNFFDFGHFRPFPMHFKWAQVQASSHYGQKLKLFQYSHIIYHSNRNFKENTNINISNPYFHSVFWKLKISQCSNFWKWVYYFVKIIYSLTETFLLSPIPSPINEIRSHILYCL